jgi:GTP-binding protein
LLWDVIKAEYVASAVKPDQYPPGELAEIAFIGRSNVGKSSLINSICRHNKLARTSGEPGKTRTVNFYRAEMKKEDGVRGHVFLVDLPGYGYAKLGHAARKDLAQWTQRYFLSSKRLRRVFLLVDIRRTMQDMDMELFLWLRGQNIPVTVIATKFDKLTKNQGQAALKTMREQQGMAGYAEVVPYSAFSSYGRVELLNLIAQVAEIDGSDDI